MYLAFVSRMASEYRCGLMDPWEIFPLKDPSGSLYYGGFLGEGESAIFHLRGVPKQGFQRQAVFLGP